MKKSVDLREYVKKLNDEDIKYINTRLDRRIGSDVAELVDFLQKNQEVDKWLSGACNADAFFDMIDQVSSHAQQEAKKRKINDRR